MGAGIEEVTAYRKSVLVATGLSWFALLIFSGSDFLPEQDMPYVNNAVESMTGLKVHRVSGWLFSCALGEYGNYNFRTDNGQSGVLCTSLGGESTVRLEIFRSIFPYWFEWFLKYINSPLLTLWPIFSFWLFVLGYTKREEVNE